DEGDHAGGDTAGLEVDGVDGELGAGDDAGTFGEGLGGPGDVAEEVGLVDDEVAVEGEGHGWLLGKAFTTEAQRHGERQGSWVQGKRQRSMPRERLVDLPQRHRGSQRKDGDWVQDFNAKIQSLLRASVSLW